MRSRFLLAVGLLLSACSGEVVVPPATVDAPADATRIPGNYAAAVVAGRWSLETTSDRFTCSAWTVEADIDPSYRQTMQAALTQALERVTFVPEPLSADQLAAQGYDAQIVVGQRDAESSFTVLSTLMQGAVRSDIDLSAIVAVQGADASVHQQTVSARGRGQSDTSYCSTIGQAITAAAQDALASIARQAVLYVQNDLNGRRLARADAAAAGRIESETLPESGAPTGSPQGAPTQSAPTYLLPRELLEPRPSGADTSKQDELRRDLERERTRGAAATEETPMNGATNSPGPETPSAGTQTPDAAPSSLRNTPAPQQDERVAVAPIPPGAAVNAGDANVDAARAFQRGVDAAAGRSVPQSDADAVRWFRAAAERGYAPAENDLGFLYAEGRGVARDDAEAVRWYKRAADRGYAPAQTSLGMMYAQGRGVPQSDFEALALYSEAANQGYPQAKANLAEMYAQGRGVPRDERTASFLLGSVQVKPLTGSGVYVESPTPPGVAPAAAPGQ